MAIKNKHMHFRRHFVGWSSNDLLVTADIKMGDSHRVSLERSFPLQGFTWLPHFSWLLEILRTFFLTQGEVWGALYVDSVSFCLVLLGLIHTLSPLFSSFGGGGGEIERSLALMQPVQNLLPESHTAPPPLETLHLKSQQQDLTILSTSSWNNYVECLADGMVKLSMRRKHIENNTESLYTAECDIAVWLPCHWGRPQIVGNATPANIRPLEFIKCLYIISLNLHISAVN